MREYSGVRPWWRQKSNHDGSMTIDLYGNIKDEDIRIHVPGPIKAEDLCDAAILDRPIQNACGSEVGKSACRNCGRRVELHPQVRIDTHLPLVPKPSLQIQSGERYVARNGKETGPAGAAAGEFCFRIDGEFYYYWPNGQPSRKISLNSCQAVPFTDPDWTLVSRLPKEPPAPKITHEAVREACITDLRALAGEYTKAIHLAHNLPISPDVSLLNGRSIVETCIRRLKDLDLDAIEG